MKKRPASVCSVPTVEVRKPLALRTTTVVVCRHGTTFWNLEKRWQGEKDTELAPEGEAQAQAQSDAFIAVGMRFDAVYTSNLKRAARTAEILAKPHGCPVHFDPRLRECSLGVWEGMCRDDIKGPKYAHIFDKLNALPHEERIVTPYFDGLETPREMALRARAVALEAAGTQEAGACILLVTHSTILEAVLAVEHGYHFEGISMRTLAWFQWMLDMDTSDGNSPELVLSTTDGITFSDGIGTK